MADTTLRLSDLPTGWTDLYARIETAEGLIWDGSAYGPFVVANIASYRVVMAEAPAGSGRYACQFPPSSPAGKYTWSIYKGSGTLSDPKYGGPDTGFWDGTTFGNSANPDLAPIQAGVDAITASLAASKKLTPAAIVTDSAPTRGGFIIAMSDGSSTPATFIWRNSEAWFDGTRDLSTGRFLLSGGKYSISTYTKLTATTARLTFSPLLPVAPANGDTLLLA